LFNAQQYFEAHEALEAVWLKAAGERKTFLHGLIQVAAAFHHHTRNNPAGFQSLLEKGDSKLAAFGAQFESIDLHDFRLQLQPWREPRHPTSLPAPPLPQIRFVHGPERG
jgi:uncharacterized protein